MHNLYRALSKNNQPDELKKLVDNLEESGISQRGLSLFLFLFHFYFDSNISKNSQSFEFSEMVERMIELADIEHAIDNPDLSTEQESNQDEIPEDEVAKSKSLNNF